MSEKWAEMDDKERVRLILQHVMGHYVLNTTAKGWDTAEYPRGIEAAKAGFHWPIAFWNTDGECWMIRDIATDPTVFDPLRDMNDAWKVIEHIVGPLNTQEELVRAANTDFTHWFDDACLWNCTAAEAAKYICLAGLRSVGIEIEE